MKKRFLPGWLAVYIVCSITGYIEHDMILHKTYMRLQPSLHATDVRSKIWAFAISEVVGTFLFTLIYARWKKEGSISEGLQYGVLTGIFVFLGRSLDTYAGTDLVPLSLCMQWLIYGIIQYVVAGVVLSYICNYKNKSFVEYLFGKK